jgi:hypothetical protein
MEQGSVGYESDIRPLFREKDVGSMSMETRGYPSWPGASMLHTRSLMQLSRSPTRRSALQTHGRVIHRGTLCERSEGPVTGPKVRVKQ